MNKLRHSLYRYEIYRSCKNAIVPHTLHTVIRMPISIGLLLYKSLVSRDVGPHHDEGALSVCLKFCIYIKTNVIHNYMNDNGLDVNAKFNKFLSNLNELVKVHAPLKKLSKRDIKLGINHGSMPKYSK